MNDFLTLADKLASQCGETLRTNARMVVAIDGFGCCGKSTLAQALAKRTGGLILETDDFHQPADGVVEAASPLAYRRWSQLAHAAQQLARGEAAHYQPIDWDTMRLRSAIEVAPASLLIIDGIGAHAIPLDCEVLRVFVDGRAETRMDRVAARDGAAHAGWDNYVAIERAYFEAFRPWRNAHLYVLGAELGFGNVLEGFAQLIEGGAIAPGQRLDRPFE